VRSTRVLTGVGEVVAELKALKHLLESTSKVSLPKAGERGETLKAVCYTYSAEPTDVLVDGDQVWADR
jgi:hypothetical protein